MVCFHASLRDVCLLSWCCYVQREQSLEQGTGAAAAAVSTRVGAAPRASVMEVCTRFYCVFLVSSCPFPAERAAYIIASEKADVGMDR